MSTRTLSSRRRDAPLWGLCFVVAAVSLVVAAEIWALWDAPPSLHSWFWIVRLAMIVFVSRAALGEFRLYRRVQREQRNAT